LVTKKENKGNTPVQIMTGVKDVFAGGYHTILLKQDGAVFTVGYHAYG